MKIRIHKFSPHQTAKVFAIIAAVSSLLFAIPIGLLTSLIPGPVNANGNPVNLRFPFGMIGMIIMPIIYGVSTYLMTLFSMWLYNVFFKKNGGIELEFEEKNL